MSLSPLSGARAFRPTLFKPLFSKESFLASITSSIGAISDQRLKRLSALREGNCRDIFFQLIEAPSTPRTASRRSLSSFSVKGVVENDGSRLLFHLSTTDL
jgi:hypothetical protein